MNRAHLNFIPFFDAEEKILFDDIEWQECIRGLAKHPIEGKPFALSYDVHKHGSDTRFTARCRAWSLEGTRSHSRMLGWREPKLTADYGAQAFTAIEFDQLIGAVDLAISEMEGGNPHGDSMLVAICRQGILIMPTIIPLTQTDEDPCRLVGSITPSNISQHQRIEVKTDLEACANVIIRHQMKLYDARRSPLPIIEVP